MNTDAWAIVPMLRRTLAVFATTLAAMTTANAAVIRFDFAGTVLHSQIGDTTGNVLTGWMQFDTALGTTHTYPANTQSEVIYAVSGSRPYSLAGQWAVAGGSSGSVGDGDYFSQTIQVVQLPPPAPNSSDRYFVTAFDQASASDMSNLQQITLGLSQSSSPSGIFDAPSNLDFDQHVSWFNPGATRNTYIQTADGLTIFDLRTMTTSIDGAVRECQETQAGLCDALAAEVPEPGTLALLGAALGGLAVVGCRKPRA